jgi:hypothetical protein
MKLRIDRIPLSIKVRSSHAKILTAMQVSGAVISQGRIGFPDIGPRAQLDARYLPTHATAIHLASKLPGWPERIASF